MSIKGFVFDFDGLILDTEAPLFKAWQEVFAENGSSLSMADWWKIIGTGGLEYDPAEDLNQKTHGKIVVEEVRKKALDRSNRIIADQFLQPGVEDFIRQAHHFGIKMAIASSSSFDWVYPFIEKFSLTNYFEGIFTSSDVEAVKPDPSLYTLAANRLGFAPDSVIAFEDSLNGVISAKAAGLYCIAIPNPITQNMDFTIADRIVESFTQLDIADLCKIA
jgi:HAD superfamily hydrolase (TIGR01509 family)